jgi:hypothetical protein
VKLVRDETRLPFHEQRIVLTGLEEGLLVRLAEREDSHQHEGGGIERDPSCGQKGRVQRAQH